MGVDHIQLLLASFASQKVVLDCVAGHSPVFFDSTAARFEKGRGLKLVGSLVLFTTQ